MNVAISSLLVTALTLVVLFTFGRDLIASFGQMSDSWTSAEERWEHQINTKIAAPPGQWTGQGATVEITVVNSGNGPLEKFADWDLILETQRDSDLGIDYFTYTTATSPGTSQWTLQGIYRDAANEVPETVGPGILDPGEEMIVLARPDAPVELGTFDRATFATPKGATAEVIFEVIVTPTPSP